jgi:hypothetical protein
MAEKITVTLMFCILIFPGDCFAAASREGGPGSTAGAHTLLERASAGFDAGEGAFALASDNSSADTVVGGILYNRDNPLVMIGQNTYSVGDSVSGGVIASISPDKIVIRFPDKEREFRAGEIVTAATETQRGPQQEPPRENYKITGYPQAVNSIVADFAAVHNKNKILFDLAKTNVADRNIERHEDPQEIGHRMISLIERYRQQLKALPVPSGMVRNYLLAVKLLDFGEDLWQALLVRDASRQRLLIERMTWIAQELKIDSSWISENFK